MNPPGLLIFVSLGETVSKTLIFNHRPNPATSTLKALTAKNPDMKRTVNIDSWIVPAYGL